MDRLERGAKSRVEKRAAGEAGGGGAEAERERAAALQAEARSFFQSRLGWGGPNDPKMAALLEQVKPAGFSASTPFVPPPHAAPAPDA